MKRMLEKAKDYTQPLTDFYGYMVRQTQLTFARLSAKGNTSDFRGVRWKWFEDQYTRKDGTVVPAEGGIPKVRVGYSHRTIKGKYLPGAAQDIETKAFRGAKKTKNELVRGRLRGSLTRITPRSRILMDRGILRQAALADFSVTTHTATLDTNLSHAKYLNAKRPFAFMTDEDINKLRDLVIRHLKS
jgi:hypothetical protein